jgi:WD40 repeat protein
MSYRQTSEGCSYPVRGVAFSPDSKTLASASSDWIIRLWDIATGAHQQTIESPGVLSCVAFSPDGKTLASNSYDNVRLWDAATGAHQQKLKGHSSQVTAVAFSPDGRTLASASEDRTVRLWDATTGAHQQKLEGHSSEVTAVAFSLDGKTLASASRNKTVRLWDVTTGAYQQTLEGHQSLRSLLFPEDSRYLKTDRGLLSLKSSSSGACLEQEPSICTVFVSEDWVTRDGQNILWLPPYYRAATCSALYENMLVIGLRSGEVILFEIVSP